ncbi:MAG: monovalent cation:proton antiporter-2 (CPA2) family protein [Pseudomonadota bacterium]
MSKSRWIMGGLGLLASGGVMAAGEASGPFGLTALETSFFEALVLIGFACLLIPLSRKLGLGSVIGYLLAGVLAGALVTMSYSEHPEELLHFAEFGVVLFLFVIGLEFQPSRLWELRGTIFGRGLVQVLASGAVLAIPFWLYGLDWRACLVVGLGLALSSTALVMREIDEGGERRTEFGETAISVLLFEDLAIVPLLIMVALLAPTGADATAAETAIAIGKALGAIIFLILVGRYGLDRMFSVLARTKTPELMTAGALGVVIFAALIMAMADLSYAMGAFVAGVMLAESSYRHEVEADIEPFRALFMGLFFVAVGLALDLNAVADNWQIILLAVPMLIVVKGIVIYLVSRIFGSVHRLSLRIALAMAQHGEFGFVLFSAAVAVSILDTETSSIVVTIVTLSMAVSSQSDRLYRLLAGEPERKTMEEDFSDISGCALIIGFGRVGQMAAQVLRTGGVPLTLIDHDADRVIAAKRFGNRVHFGDGRRREVLKAAGAEEVRLILVCVDDTETIDQVFKVASKHFRNAKVVVRAYDRLHALALMAQQADAVVRETASGGIEMGAEALRLIGIDEAACEDAVTQTREADEARLARQFEQTQHATDRQTVMDSVVPEPLHLGHND